MKIKLLCFPLLALCALMLCGKFAQPTSAVSASVAAKEHPVVSTDKTLDQGWAALKSEQHDQAAKAAKQVLSTSSDSNARIKAYRLLITAVRASDGYDAAIKRCENAYAFARKNHAASQELVCVKAILADLKQRRSAYLRTIAEQRKVIQSDKDSDHAARAALKLASCKQALGPREEAIKAYEAVVKDYPLTRPGWKAAQELAWMRRPKGAASAAKPSEPPSASLSDGLQALKEGRLSEAEKTARTLLSSSDATIHSGALDLLIEALAKSSGVKVARTQAWQMACGTKEFKPSYSDVLRLEATVADLIDEPVKANETVAKKDDSAKPADLASAETDSSTDVEASYDTNEPVRGNRQRPSTAGTMASAAPQQGGFSGLPVGGAWPGVGPGVSTPKRTTPKTSTPVASSPIPNPSQPAPVQPQPTQPVTPTPVKPGPDPGNPVIPPPVKPEPPFDQWTCSKEYEEAGDDLEKVRSLVEEHIEKAQPLLRCEVRERKGLGVVLGAAMCAFDKLNDTEWALSICDDYVLPHMKAARPEKYRYLAKPLVEGRVARMWVAATEYDRAIEILQQMLDEESDVREADATRVRLAQVCDLAGQYEEAIAYLKEIDDNGDLAGAKLYISDLEKKMEEEQ